MFCGAFICSSVSGLLGWFHFLAIVKRSNKHGCASLSAVSACEPPACPGYAPHRLQGSLMSSVSGNPPHWFPWCWAQLSLSLTLLTFLFARILVSVYCCAVSTELKRNLKRFESALPWWLRMLNTCQIFLLPLLKTAFRLLVHLFMCISLLLEVSVLVFCFVRQGLTVNPWLCRSNRPQTQEFCFPLPSRCWD